MHLAGSAARLWRALVWALIARDKSKTRNGGSQSFCGLQQASLSPPLPLGLPHLLVLALALAQALSPSLSLSLLLSLSLALSRTSSLVLPLLLSL